MDPLVEERETGVQQLLLLEDSSLKYLPASKPKVEYLPALMRRK